MSTTPLLNHDLLAQVLECVPAPIVVSDVEGRIVLFNPAAEAVSGYSVDEVVGERFWDVLIGSGEGDSIRGDFERALAGDDPVDHEHAWITKSGARKTVSWRARVLRDGAGAPTYLLATGVDVTDRLDAEERAQAFAAEDPVREARERELLASERRLSGIVSLAPDAIVFADERQRISLFNEGAERIFGYAAEEVVGRHLGTLMPRRFRAVHRRHVREFGRSPVQARKMGERHSILGLRRDGTEFPAEASIVKLDVDGERIYAVLLRDVSDRIRVQETQRFLAEVGEVFNSSLDYAETLRSVARLAVRSLAQLCIIDMVQPDGSVHRLEAVHREPEHHHLARQLFSFPLDRSRPHLLGRALMEGKPELHWEVTPEDLDALAQDPNHRELLGRLELESYMSVPLFVRDQLAGAILFASTAGTRRYDEDDLALAEELARRAALAVENARLYGDAQRALRGRDHVLGIVSHDLGNPLQAIAIATEGLEGVVPHADERVRYYLDALSRSSRLMERLIHDLLAVRRMEEGHLEVEMGRHDVADLVAGSLELLEPLATVKSIELVDGVKGARLPPVEVDQDRLIQVLSNLVGNAVKHSPAAARVTVRAAQRDGEIVVSIEDTGPGIPADELPQVFEPFWRARKSPGGGIGLGLSIAREIVRSHGGRVWAESEVGRGSTFHFSLPVPHP